MNITASILPLSASDSLQIRIPSISKYEPDELEIWWANKNDEICLYRDSFHGSFLTECLHVVNCFRNHVHTNTADPITLPNRFFDFLCLKSHDTLWDFELFSDKSYVTFLTEDPKGNAVLIISQMDPYADVPYCEIHGYFTIGRHTFLQWWDNVSLHLKDTFE